jgi:hypothetical protein
MAKCHVDAERRTITLLPGGYLQGPISFGQGWKVEAVTGSRRSSRHKSSA